MVFELQLLLVTVVSLESIEACAPANDSGFSSCGTSSFDRFRIEKGFYQSKRENTKKAFLPAKKTL
jgi:hypothetical protein